MSYIDVLAAALELPRSDQQKLAHALTASWTANGTYSNMTPELQIELERRIATYEQNPSIGISLEEIEQDMELYLQELGE